MTLWTVAHQVPLSMGFFTQEHWSGLPCPPPGDLPDQGSNSHLLRLLHGKRDSLPLSHRSPYTSCYPVNGSEYLSNYEICCLQKFKGPTGHFTYLIVGGRDVIICLLLWRALKWGRGLKSTYNFSPTFWSECFISSSNANFCSSGLLNIMPLI